MDRRICALAWCAIVACLLSVSGCGWPGAQADGEPEEEAVAAAGEAAAVAPPAAAPAAPAPPSQLGIKVGDRFPLMKTVEQTLRQPSPQGLGISRSTLEMLLSITVEELRQPEPLRPEDDSHRGQKRLKVKYDRIRFAQELPGVPRVEYDSNAPAGPISPAARGFEGLKDNGFAFWLSSDNQFVELVGFDDFFNRCWKDVATEQRRQMFAAAASPPTEAIANFVDDSVGLLPAMMIREGDAWTRDRQISLPVPVRTSTKYTLRRLNSETAEIDVLGTIFPSPHAPQPAIGDVGLIIRGGQSFGSCLVDRRTGLPILSSVEQTLDMFVKAADGSEFEQQKTTVTTIKSFPETGSIRTASGEARELQIGH
ncbi:MAG TPA: DUF6263 family protein [Planctomycetaceae bacterium]|nr:DUF6263 family protein [Planctomycetaceae bacterium]